MSSSSQLRKQRLGRSLSPNRKELFPSPGRLSPSDRRKKLFPDHSAELFPNHGIELFPICDGRSTALLSYQNTSSSPTRSPSASCPPKDCDLMFFNVSPLSTKAQPSTISSPIRPGQFVSPTSSPPHFHPLLAKPIHDTFHLTPRRYDSSPKDPFSPKRAFTNPNKSRTVRTAKMAENGKELEGDGRQRPETTDIVARRIIGSVLGINLAKRTDEKSIAFDLALKEKRTKQAAELGSLAEGHVIEAENNVVADTRTKAVQWSHANWGVGETEEGDEKWRLFAQRARESAKKGLRAAAEGKEPLDSWGRLAVERGLKAVEVSIESLRKESQATESDDEG